MSRYTGHSIRITMTDVQWAAMVAMLSNGHTDDPATEGASKAFLAQVAYEAVRGNGKSNGKSHEKRA